MIAAFRIAVPPDMCLCGSYYSPDDKRQIVSAKIVMVGKDYRTEVASANLQ